MCWPVSFFPARPTALHPHCKQTLQAASTLPVPSGKTQSPRSGIIHAIGFAAMALEVGDRLDRMVYADPLIAPRWDQFLQNVGRCAPTVEEGLLPASEPFASRRRILQHLRGSPELFRQVIEIDKTVEVVSEFGREAFLSTDSTSPGARRRAAQFPGPAACSAASPRRRPCGRASPGYLPPACIHNGSYIRPRRLGHAASPCRNRPYGNCVAPASCKFEDVSTRTSKARRGASNRKAGTSPISLATPMDGHDRMRTQDFRCSTVAAADTIGQLKCVLPECIMRV
jgi:hypothetical protein